MSKIILSICIPTYNRVNEVVARLDDLSNQINKLNSNLYTEIVISDNCSTDDTENAIEEFIKNYQNINIIYNKNIKNIGYGKNINKLIELANGEYIWLCGDDDKINDKALQNLYNIITVNSPDYILLNSSSYDKKINLVKEKQILKDLESSFVDSSLVISEYFEIIVFIGSNVFKKSLAMKAINVLNGQVSDVYQNSILSFLIMKDIEKVYVSKYNYVQDTLGNKNYTIRQYLDVPILEYIKMKQLTEQYNNTYFFNYLNKKIYKHIIFYGYKILLWKIFRNSEVFYSYKEIWNNKQYLTIPHKTLILLFFTLSKTPNFILKLLLLVVLKFNFKKYKNIKTEVLSLVENTTTKYMEENK